MATVTQQRTRLDGTDKGEWLSRLLDDVQTEQSYAPSPIALLRMRTRLFEQMAEPIKQAA